MSDVTATTLSLPAAGNALHEVLREGARKMLAQAIEAEVADWIESHARLTDEAGRRQVVRNGYANARKLVTPVGELAVRQPRVHDRRPADQREPFRSKLLPPYLRKTRSVEELIPFLYLKGVSTGDFTEALAAILGPGCPGLSATGLSFYDFPAEHWRHLRTTNPIESTFATIRLRHRRTKGSGSRTASLTMMFKLAESAAKRWRLLNGSDLLPAVLQGVPFQNGLLLPQAAA